MKDRIIDCICEIIKAYSLESEWTPEIETEIRKISRFSVDGLLVMLDTYSFPSHLLFRLNINITDEYSQNLYDRFSTNIYIRKDIIKKYNL